MILEFPGGGDSGPRRDKIGSIYVHKESDIVRVRDRVRVVARELGFDNVTQIKVTTAVSELARNVYEYAGEGVLTVSLVRSDGRMGMELVCEDNGPGIANLDQIMAGEYTSRSGLGRGLPGSRRLLDDFRIESEAGRGTRIEATKWFEQEQRPLRSVDQIREAFFSASEASLAEELQSQNQELVRVLSELTQNRRELERTNREVTEANERLRQVDETKSRFISTIAHEVRTPLTAIVGLVQLLLRDKKTPLAPQHREIVERLNTSATMLTTLVNDLLDLSRLRSGKMQVKIATFDAVKIIESICDSLKPTAEDKGVRLTCEHELDKIEVKSDQTKVTQVVTNLLSNAIKFTPPGGSVTARTGMEAGGMWRAEVTDTGIGISEEQLPQIFEEFRQVNISNRYHAGGTGLGLPISKRLVELLGGRLKVVSAPDVGSTFTAILPVDAAPYVPESLIAT